MVILSTLVKRFSVSCMQDYKTNYWLDIRFEENCVSHTWQLPWHIVGKIVDLKIALTKNFGRPIGFIFVVIFFWNNIWLDNCIDLKISRTPMPTAACTAILFSKSDFPNRLHGNGLDLWSFFHYIILFFFLKKNSGSA